MSFGKVETVTVIRRKGRVRINKSDYDPKTDVLADDEPAPESPEAPEENSETAAEKPEGPYVDKGPFGKWYVFDAKGKRQKTAFETKEEAEAALAKE